MALSKAGFAKLSSALTLIDGLKGETECESDPEILIRAQSFAFGDSDVS